MQNKILVSELGSGIETSRREFLAAASLAPLCCVSQPAAQGSWSITDGILRIDLTIEPVLGKIGEARTIIEPGRKLNIIVVQHERGKWAAVDRTCTHGGAMCAYQQRTRTLRCTSLNHAEYTLDGKLLHGRTHGDLHRYPVAAHERWIEVSLEEKP